MKVVLELFGPNYEGNRYNPMFRCIRDAALMKEAHHCPEDGGHALVLRCVEKGHIRKSLAYLELALFTDILTTAYCLEWICGLLPAPL
jgi:hypothetical protein